MGGRGKRKQAQAAVEEEEVANGAEAEAEVEEETWVFRCHCTAGGAAQTNFDDSRAMIECERCREWTHTRCNQLQRCVNYVCARCVTPEPPLLPTGSTTKSGSPRTPTPKPAGKKQVKELTASEPAPAAATEAAAAAGAAGTAGVVPEDAASRFGRVYAASDARRKVRGGDQASTSMGVGGSAAPQAPLCEFELERQKNIQRNLERLQALGVKDTLGALALTPVSTPFKHPAPKVATSPRLRVATAAPAPAPTVLTRRARRVSGSGELAAPMDENDPAHQNKRAKAGDDLAADLDHGALLTLDEYYERAQIIPGQWMTGHYSGWVKEEVLRRHGIAVSAAAAWEAGGGGKFSRKLPPGMTAKEAARRLLHKNPNQYFYRHNEPGEEQYTGNWTKEEIELFVRTAETYGCGDKWGLFSSHIPHRVGYQCSAIYRQVIIPAGLLRDPNFKMTAGGVAVWAPAKKA